MATEKVSETYARDAGVDLTGKLYYLATINSSEQIVLCGAGAMPLGSIYEEAVAGKPATIALRDIIKVIFTTALAAGVNVASDANGKGVAASVGNAIIGVVVEGTDGNNQIGSVAVRPGHRHA